MRISDWSSDVCSSDLAGGCTCSGDLVRHHQRMIQTFDLARPSDQDERQVIADADIAYLHMLLGRGNFLSDHNTSSIRATSTGLFNSQKRRPLARSEEHTSELQSLMRISYAVFCLKKNKLVANNTHIPPLAKYPNSIHYTNQY